MMLRAIVAGIGFFAGFSARADEVTVIPRQPPAHERYSAVGIASWYGNELRGHRTADGEIFDSQALTAAHKTLPLPCYARVTNLGNGRSVVVRVNDRGPFVGGRIADVSARVASLLEFSHDGVAKIRLDYIGKAPPAGSDAAKMSANVQTAESPKAAKLLGVDTVTAKKLSDEIMTQARYSPTQLHFEDAEPMPWIHNTAVKTTSVMLDAMLETNGGFAGDEKLG